MKRAMIFVLLFAIMLVSTSCTNRQGANMDVVFREVDLNEPYWAGESWEEMGGGTNVTVDLSQFSNQAIESIQTARKIADEILEQSQGNWGAFENFVLRRIDHDPVQSIWIFRYAQYPPVPGMSFYAAVDGNTSEVLRLWVD